jgi:hypothetical protein
MKLLTQRTLRVFAVLEHYRAGSDDILDALLPFFEPIVAELNGSMFDPGVFAARVHEAYRWNFTRDIAEEFIPRFEMRQWVKKIAAGAQDAAYQICYDGSGAGGGGQAEAAIGRDLSEIAKEFRAFVIEISPLTTFDRSEVELSDLLVEWLISIDAYTEDVLHQRAIQATLTEGRMGLTVELPDPSGLTSEERYLCARFVKHLFNANSTHIQSLCKLASVGLLTEVIQDFRKPITRVDQITLTIYLDAPVALDLLGTSGEAAAQNIRPILSKLAEIGASTAFP